MVRTDYKETIKRATRGSKAGGGQFANVYADPDDGRIVHKVLKGDDRAYRTWLEQIVLPGQDIAALPKVYEYKVWPVRGELRSYVKLEKLTPITDAPLFARQQAADLVVAADLLYDDKTTVLLASSTWLSAGERRWFRKGGGREALFARVRSEQPDAWDILTELVPLARKHDFANDLHTLNVMYRAEDRIVVITDPIYDGLGE